MKMGRRMNHCGGSLRSTGETWGEWAEERGEWVEERGKWGEGQGRKGGRTDDAWMVEVEVVVGEEVEAVEEDASVCDYLGIARTCLK